VISESNGAVVRETRGAGVGAVVTGAATGGAVGSADAPDPVEADPSTRVRAQIPATRATITAAAASGSSQGERINPVRAGAARSAGGARPGPGGRRAGRRSRRTGGWDGARVVQLRHVVGLAAEPVLELGVVGEVGGPGA
jgi:hypothetical protein